jgi:orotidine-5'-phosphate decarboxylase
MDQKRVIVALDYKNVHEALVLAEKLSGSVWGFKVHHLLLQEALLKGQNIITELKKYGSIMYDLKHHDVPATVSDEVAVAALAGANIITIHASGGAIMVAKAVESRHEAQIAVVTVLTSLNPEDTKRIYGRTPNDAVRELAHIAAEGGAQAIVSSPQELAMLASDNLVKHLTRITPGIRSAHDPVDDQKRTASAREAITGGADLLVVGRPITRAQDPLVALGELFK